MTVSERLRWALKVSHVSIRSLQRTLHEAGVPGSSYATVHGYVSGGREPRRYWINEVARILGVRSEWLATGEGEMTEIGQSIQELHDTPRDLGEYAKDLWVQIEIALPKVLIEEVFPETSLMVRYFLLRYYTLSEGGSEKDLRHDPPGGELPTVAAIRDFCLTDILPETWGKAPGSLDAAVLARISAHYLTYFGR